MSAAARKAESGEAGPDEQEVSQGDIKFELQEEEGDNGDDNEQANMYQT